MGHQGATFGQTKWSQPYVREPHLPPDLLRTRRTEAVKKSFSPPPKSKFCVVQTRKLRSRKRIVNYKPLIVLAPTIVLSLLIVKLLFSFLPTFFRASVPHQFEGSARKTAVLLSPVQVNPPATPQVIALRRAIIGKESEANFQALNPHSKALGLAQIMPENLSDWSKELLGHRLTSDEFLNDPGLQLLIIDQKLSQYWQKAIADSGGNEDLAVLKVASNWYSGKPNRYKSRTPQWYKGTDGRLHRYPSIAEYSHLVLKKYRQYRGA